MLPERSKAKMNEYTGTHFVTLALIAYHPEVRNRTLRLREYARTAKLGASKLRINRSHKKTLTVMFQRVVVSSDPRKLVVKVVNAITEQGYLNNA
jgi:hypothetical protein